MTILEFVNLLLTCCPAVYHNEAFKEKSEYIVWQEIGVRPWYADNTRNEEPRLIAVDFLTKNELSPTVDTIRTVFAENEITYRGPDIIYHEEVDYTQYAYTVELI